MRFASLPIGALAPGSDVMTMHMQAIAVDARGQARLGNPPDC
jgi:hypothetical protein